MEVMWRVVLTVSLLWWGICSSEAKVTCKNETTMRWTGISYTRCPN
uniref:Uncharacterized protein n=1 Tax=Anguilla anguilla TaxID=7936 RepID=A0A0E9XWW5_ANGAN